MYSPLIRYDVPFSNDLLFADTDIISVVHYVRMVHDVPIPLPPAIILNRALPTYVTFLCLVSISKSNRRKKSIHQVYEEEIHHLEHSSTIPSNLYLV